RAIACSTSSAVPRLAKISAGVAMPWSESETASERVNVGVSQDVIWLKGGPVFAFRALARRIVGPPAAVKFALESTKLSEFLAIRRDPGQRAPRGPIVSAMLTR